VTRALLRLASWIVPRDDRADWLAEWRGELRHVADAGVRPLRFTLGAFPDALWLRRHDQTPRPPLLASPAHCLMALAAVAWIGFVLRPPIGPPQNIVSVRSHWPRALLTYDQYRLIAANPPAAFEAVGFYRRDKRGVAATRTMKAVLRGSPLPGGQYYFFVDDPGPGPGYVLARVRESGPMFHISARSPRGGRDLFDCVPEAPGNPAFAVLLVFGVAVLLVPLLTTLSLGGLRHGWRASAFFAVKLALALAAAGSLAFALAVTFAPLLIAHGLIVALILAIRWACKDQRARCPVCLRRLATPVSFGCLSHTLLEWHGSESICPRGHGLLQVSATPASPYAPLQWLRL